jgi:dTDP-4-dehydrorhamnose reductase
VRVAVTGAGGLVGGALCRLAPAGWDLVAMTRASSTPPGVASVACELTDVTATAGAMSEIAPDVVVHCAYSRARPDIVDATASVVAACRATGAALVHVSTDLVFDGGSAPYRECDEPRPTLAYGRDKWEAERVVGSRLPDAAIVRTSIVVSASPLDAASRWLVEALSAGRPVTLFSDEIRTPVLVEDLVESMAEIVGRPDRAGIWHVAGPEAMSRVELGHRIAAMQGLDAAPIVVASAASSGEPRPRDVSLSCGRALAALSVRPRRLGSIA